MYSDNPLTASQGHNLPPDNVDVNSLDCHSCNGNQRYLKQNKHNEI